jgi:hypothetical protein
VYFVQHYVIDWDKVQTLDDLKRIVASIQFSFEPNCPQIESIKDLVQLVDKPKITYGV